MSAIEIPLPPMTAEELFRLPSDRRCELIEGKLVDLSPTGENHCVSGGRLFALAGAHVLTEDLGEVYLSEAGFVLRRDLDTVMLLISHLLEKNA